MKFLVAICSLQVFLTLFLIVSINRDDDKTEFGAQAVDSGATPIARNYAAPVAVAASFDEERLRQIIREEVSYLAQEIGAFRQQEDDPVAMATEDRQVRAMQKEYVAQQIDYYRSLGSISQEEMVELQSELANLASSDRGPMLSRLVKAMNAGEIRGKLQ